MLLARRDAVLGVQFGARTVRLVELGSSRRGGLCVRRRASAALPDAAAGDLLPHAAVLAQLAADAATRTVVLELPLAAVFCQHLSVPAELDDDALEPLVELEACRLLGVQPGELALDFGRCWSDAQHAHLQPVLLAAARRQQVLERVQLARLARLRPLAVEVDALAARRAVLRQLGAGAAGCIALLDVESGGASLQLWQDGEVRMLQHLRWGTQPQSDALLAALTGALRMATDAASAARPQRLLLSGELPVGADLERTLSTRLELDVAVFDPWQSLQPQLPAEPAYCVASGLALRAFTIAARGGA